MKGDTSLTAVQPVPEGTTIHGRILFVHGFCEYSGLYVRLFDHLSSAGYEVFFFDQRGSGLTSPGKLKGLTDEKHTFDDLDFFIERNLKEVQEHKIPGLFLLGHSMGGGTILTYGINGKYKDQIRGIVVTGPLILLHPSSRPGIVKFKFLSWLMNLFPNHTIDTNLKQEYITSDPEWSHFAANSPVVVPLLGSLRQIFDFLLRGQRLLEPQNAKRFDRPVLIIVGDEDKINDPEASHQFFNLIQVEDKTLRDIKTGRHSIFIERQEIYDEVKKDLLEWLSTH